MISVNFAIGLSCFYMILLGLFALQGQSFKQRDKCKVAFSNTGLWYFVVKYAYEVSP